jgi:hypothetical protein
MQCKGAWSGGDERRRTCDQMIIKASIECRHCDDERIDARLGDDSRRDHRKWRCFECRSTNTRTERYSESGMAGNVALLVIHSRSRQRKKPSRGSCRRLVVHFLFFSPSPTLFSIYFLFFLVLSF